MKLKWSGEESNAGAEEASRYRGLTPAGWLTWAARHTEHRNLNKIFRHHLADNAKIKNL